jgi:hypothetical protein
MPIPKPSKGEKESDFISRCMGNEVMLKDYPKQKQRAGVCYSRWRSVHGKAETEKDFMAGLDKTGINDAGNSDKVTLKGRSSEVVRIETPMQVSNARFYDVGSTAAVPEDDPFAKLELKPDRWKAYMDFDIVHCMPAVIGPVQEGFYSTYLPKITAASHGSLLHQQMNLNHLLKQYSKDDKEISRDRIVGCVVATWFPPEPNGGWKIGDDPEKAPSIRARAVIFKLADGVNRMIGDHQASRSTQSVSVESITTWDNLGIYLPSRGADKITALMDIENDAELMAVFDPANPLRLGKVNGEQAVFVFGINGPVDFRGVGITPRPAEREAKIITFKAERSETADGGTLIAMAASMVDQEIMGRKVTFKTGRTGTIDKLWNEGIARLQDMNWGMKATLEEPVVRVKLGPSRSGDLRPGFSDGARFVLRRMSELKGAIEH